MPSLIRMLRHELLILHRQRAAWIVVGLLLGLASYGLWNGADLAAGISARDLNATGRMDQRLRDWEAASRTPLTASVRGPDARSAYAIGAQVWELAMPGSPTGLLAIGESDLQSSGTEGYLWSTPDKLFARADPANPWVLRTGRVDLPFVLVYLLPVMVLAVSFDMLSSEREAGILPWLRANAIGLPTVILAKSVARLVPIVLTIVLIAGGARLMLTGPSHDHFYRLLLFAVVAGVYGLFWLVLAVAVNLTPGSSETNAAALLAAWAVLVVVVPALASSTASMRYPMPPRAQLIIADRDADPDVVRQGPSALAQAYAEHPEWRPPVPQSTRDEFRSMLLMVFLKNLAAYQPVVDRQQTAMSQQAASVRRWTRCSPAVVAREALDDIAGTGTRRFVAFREQVHDWIDQQRAFFIPRILSGRALGEIDYAALPVFRFSEPSLTSALPDIGSNLLSLAMATIVAGCAAVVVGAAARR